MILNVLKSDSELTMSEKECVSRGTPPPNHLSKSFRVSVLIQTPRNQNGLEHSNSLQECTKLLISKLFVYPSLLTTSSQTLKIKFKRHNKDVLPLNLQIQNLLERRDPNRWWESRICWDKWEQTPTFISRIKCWATQNLFERVGTDKSGVGITLGLAFFLLRRHHGQHLGGWWVLFVCRRTIRGCGLGFGRRSHNRRERKRKRRKKRRKKEEKRE